MNGVKHTAKRTTSISRSRKPSRKHIRLTAPALLALLLVVFTVGGTLAYLTTHTEPIENKFTPAKVSCKVNETFSGNTKSSITVENTGDIYAYLRVKLLSYRVNESGAHIGGTVDDLNFTPGSGWIKDSGYYYYTQPIAPNEQTGDLLETPIALVQYDDADGGKQVIEVMAEAIQSEPAAAVGEAWGVSITLDGVTAYSSGN